MQLCALLRFEAALSSLLQHAMIVNLSLRAAAEQKIIYEHFKSPIVIHSSSFFLSCSPHSLSPLCRVKYKLLPCKQNTSDLVVVGMEKTTEVSYIFFFVDTNDNVFLPYIATLSSVLPLGKVDSKCLN